MIMQKFSIILWYATNVIESMIIILFPLPREVDTWKFRSEVQMEVL